MAKPDLLREHLVVAGDDLFKQFVVPEGLWNMLDRSSPSGCWLWKGGKNGNGYGQFRTPQLMSYLQRKGLCPAGRRSMLAHIALWRLKYGPFPAVGDWTLDHVEGTCGTRDKLCCNPDHLELVPRSVNSKRANDSNIRPMEVVLPLFWPYRFDLHVPAALNLTERFVPSERPSFRATRIPAGLLYNLNWTSSEGESPKASLELVRSTLAPEFGAASADLALVA